jgi:apolipoprotein D and lipocalin family protein
MKYFGLFILLLLSGCATIPEGLVPVTGFDVERYMGKWYEIERIDNYFEAGLTDVSAEYHLLPDGKIEVVNRGFRPREKNWRIAPGLAWFDGNKEVAKLKISFGSPISGTYNVLVLDTQYRYAMVAGKDYDNLWILSREPQLDKSIIDSLVAKAKEFGFPSDNLVYVEQKALKP